MRRRSTPEGSAPLEALQARPERVFAERERVARPVGDERRVAVDTRGEPRVVAGTWTEYIHVRYGRAILGGVQIEEKKFDDGGRTNPAEEKK